VAFAVQKVRNSCETAVFWAVTSFGVLLSADPGVPLQQQQPATTTGSSLQALLDMVDTWHVPTLHKRPNALFRYPAWLFECKACWR